MANRLSFRVITALPTVQWRLTQTSVGLTVLDGILEAWTALPTPPSGMDVGQRGRYFENGTPANLLGNFEGIDDFQDGVATSIRTHNRSTAEGLLQAIREDARELRQATSKTLSGVTRDGSRLTVVPNDVAVRQLAVGIPAVQSELVRDSTFVGQLNQIANNVRVVIRVIPIRGWR